MIQALIIDDEQHARDELSFLLTDSGKFEIVDQCKNAIEGINSIHKHKPDVVFLDIQMPVISGIELIAMIDDDDFPRVVFVTAYDEFALKAIEENAFDYLLKPVEVNRLNKCVARLEKDIHQKHTPHLNLPSINRIPCYLGKKIKLINPKDVEFSYSDISGVHIVTQKKEFFTNITLKTIEKRTDLFRCHKQYLVNPETIDEIHPLETGAAELITVSKKRIPVSRRFLKPLKEQLFV